MIYSKSDQPTLETIRTVLRATPSNSTDRATWTYYVREKWYYHDTESGQEMMTGPASTDDPIMRLIDRDGDGDFDGPNEEQHFVNDHQGSTVLVTGKATLDSEGNLTSRAPTSATSSMTSTEYPSSCIRRMRTVMAWWMPRT